MPFESLPSHNLQIPEFRPAIVTQLPKQSIWPGIAQGVAGTVGTLAKALDPVEKAQRKLALAQLSWRTQAMDDIQSGRISRDKINPATMMPYTPREQLELDYMKERNYRLRRERRYQEASRTETFGNDKDSPYSQADVNGLPTDIPPDGTGGTNYGPPPTMDALPSTFGRGQFGGY